MGLIDGLALAASEDLEGESVVTAGIPKVFEQVLQCISDSLASEPSFYDLAGNKQPFIVKPKCRNSFDACLLDKCFHSEEIKKDSFEKIEAIRKKEITTSICEKRKRVVYYHDILDAVEIMVPVTIERTVQGVLASGLILLSDPVKANVRGLSAKVLSELEGIDILPKDKVEARSSFLEDMADSLSTMISVEDHWEKLLELATNLNRETNLEQTYNLILETGLPMVGEFFGAVFEKRVNERQEEELRLVAHKDATIPIGTVMPRSKGYSWEIIDGRATLVEIPDVDAPECKERFFEVRQETKAELIVALKYETSVYGVLVIGTDNPSLLTEETKTILKALAALASIAIRKNEIHEASLFEQKKLRILNEVGRELNSTDDLREVLREAVKAITEQTDARLCYIFMESDCQTGVRLVAATSGFNDLVERLEYVPGEGFTGSVFAEGKSRLENNLNDSCVHWKGKYIKEWNERTGNAPVKSLAASPIKFKGKSIGVICLTNKKRGSASEYFDTKDLDILEALCEIFGGLFHRAFLIAKYESILDNAATGLVVIGRTFVEKRYCPATKDSEPIRTTEYPILWANRRQSIDFEGIQDAIEKKSKPCYEVFNPCMGITTNCAWCPVKPVLWPYSEEREVESITHSPTGPDNFIRHYRVVASPIENLMGERYAALESIFDMTDAVEIMDLFRKLNLAKEHKEVYRAITEAMGRTLQSPDGLILKKEKGQWILAETFSSRKDVYKEEMEQATDIATRYGSKDPASLAKYLTERPNQYEFASPTDPELDEEWHGVLSTLKSRPLFPSAEQLATLGDLLPKGLTKAVLLPVAISERDGGCVVLCGEEKGYLEEFKTLQTTFKTLSSGIDMAEERLRYFNAVLKLLSSVMTAGNEEQFGTVLQTNAPELLKGCRFSAFKVEGSPGVQTLRCFASTGLYTPQGEKVENISTMRYLVGPEEGMTAWVAYYNEVLNIPAKYLPKDNSTKVLDAFFNECFSEAERNGKTPPVVKRRSLEDPQGCAGFLGVPVRSVLNPDVVIGVFRISAFAADETDYNSVEFGPDLVRILQVCAHSYAILKDHERLRQNISESISQYIRTHYFHSVLNDYRYHLNSLSMPSPMEKKVRDELQTIDAFLSNPTCNPTEGNRNTDLLAATRIQVEHMKNAYEDWTFDLRVSKALPSGAVLPVALTTHEAGTIIHELLRNAVKHNMDLTDERRKKVIITLGIANAGDKGSLFQQYDQIVSLTVEDYGKGIRSPNKLKIFSRFSKAIPKQGGLGLQHIWDLIVSAGGSVREKGRSMEEVTVGEEAGALFEILMPLV